MRRKNSINAFSMQRHSSQQQNKDHLCVITLKRTPDRLQYFFRRNVQALKKWNVCVIEGIDGDQQKDLFKKSRLISQNIARSWTSGAIGSALSHMHCWRMCTQLDKPLVIAEDDTILSMKMSEYLEKLLIGREDSPSFLLLGWNLDSLLQAELEPGLGLISLFEPAYPEEEEITELVNSTTERRACKLKRCFGLPAYRITPKTAKYLLEKLNPLTSEEISMGRGIPTHYSETLDGILNNQYEKIEAKIVFPPLALALNDQNKSLTRKPRPQNFKN